MAKFREIFRGKSKYVTVRPEMETESTKREVPDGLWTKCDQCRAMLYHKDLERNLWVCDKCGFHFPIGASVRLAQLIDDLDEFEELDASLAAGNPLNFPEYPEKLQRGRDRTGRHDAVVTGVGRIGGIKAVVAVMDFHFMGGSMGSVVGERVTRAFEYAAEQELPIVTVAASGGARMQEGILSLMQMQKTAAAVELYGRRGLLFISVLTQPTTAGVFGSFASLGDINIAEPGATIGFAGQRVIEETIRKAVPPNLQKAETVFENGFIDKIIPRTELKDELAKLLLWHTAKEPIVPAEDDAAASSKLAPGEADEAREDAEAAESGESESVKRADSAVPVDPGESDKRDGDGDVETQAEALGAEHSSAHGAFDVQDENAGYANGRAATNGRSSTRYSDRTP